MTAIASISDAELADDLDGSLRDDLCRQWYPRCIDPKGGYVENFDHAWRATGDDRRSLVHQARLAWTAAAFAGHDRSRHDEFVSYAVHGMRFIHAVLRDEEHGGFYFDTGIDGRPLRNGDKHAYALAYAAFAGAKTWSVSGEQIALDVASDAVSFLARYARKSDGLYHEDISRDGTPLVEPTEPARRRMLGLLPRKSRLNPLGCEYGRTTLNTHIHLLEAYTEVYRADPSESSRNCLESIFPVVRDAFVAGDVLADSLDQYCVPGALPAGHGHVVETAFLLLDGAAALGATDDAPIIDTASRLARNVLSSARDAHHGGTCNRPATDHGDRIWWVAAEALNTWATMYRLAIARDDAIADRDLWRGALVDEWTFIRKHLIDGKGGWLQQTARDGTPRGRLPRSDPWTDPYHNGRALINAVTALRETGK